MSKKPADSIASLKEDQLRKEVLIPLFTKMGFQDVYEYHGGSLEQGKDVVMWKQEGMRERVNYGVVVKAQKISGKVTSRSSAGEVLLQISQCFNSPYKDPITGGSRSVDRCYVICSKQITKEALNAMSGTLASQNLDKVTDFIRGAKLRELVAQYLPWKDTIDRLKEIGHSLSEMDSPFRFVPTVEDGKVQVAVHAKSTDQAPLTVKTVFSIPDDEDGMKIREQIKSHFETGAPLIIPKPYLKEFQMPESIMELMGQSSHEPQELRVTPNKEERALPAKLKVELDNGSLTVLDYVEFDCTQAGTEEATFSNERQGMPWVFAFRLHPKTGHVGLEYRINYAGPVKRVLEGLHFQKALHAAGQFCIEHADTGIEIARVPTMAGEGGAPDTPWITLVERLYLIQTKTEQPLSIPERDIDDQEVSEILMVADLLEKGSLEIPADSVTFGLVPIDAPDLFRKVEESKCFPFAIKRHEQKRILDTVVPIGVVEYSCERVTINEDELQRAKKEAERSPDGPIRFVLHPEEMLSMKLVQDNRTD